MTGGHRKGVPSIGLSNGVMIPMVGLCTWTMDDAIASRAIEEAVRLGYRHIDTAWRYQNEKGVGIALKYLFDNDIIKRDEVFITSKVWNTFHSRERAVLGIKESLRNLGLNYLDLTLIHWPTGFKSDDTNMYPKYPNGLIRAGLTRAIGVSNFNERQIDRILRESSIKPAVNQVYTSIAIKGIAPRFM